MDYFCVHSAVSMEFSPIFLVHNDFCRSMSGLWRPFLTRANAQRSCNPGVMFRLEEGMRGRAGRGGGGDKRGGITVSMFKG